MAGAAEGELPPFPSLPKPPKPAKIGGFGAPKRGNGGGGEHQQVRDTAGYPAPYRTLTAVTTSPREPERRRAA